MDFIPNNKMEYLKKQNLSVEVTKSKDVMGNDSIRAVDILNGKKDDKKVDIMSDVFPRNGQNANDILS